MCDHGAFLRKWMSAIQDSAPCLTNINTSIEVFLFSYYDICMKRLESQEDYLEKILQLSREKESVHAIDIARGLSFSKPSVSIAMNKLKELGFIEINKKGEITLTPEGLIIAEKTLEKHETLTQLLINLGVDEETAKEDACRMEHDISDKTWDAIKNHVKQNGR